MNDVDTERLAKWHGLTLPIMEINRKWLENQVRGYIIWKALAHKPDATPTEYYNFTSSLELAKRYLACMGGES